VPRDPWCQAERILFGESRSERTGKHKLKKTEVRAAHHGDCDIHRVGNPGLCQRCGGVLTTSCPCIMKCRRIRCYLLLSISPVPAGCRLCGRDKSGCSSLGWRRLLTCSDFLRFYRRCRRVQCLLADPTRTIVQEVNDLFKPGGGYKTRFSRFLDGRWRGVQYLWIGRRTCHL